MSKHRPENKMAYFLKYPLAIGQEHNAIHTYQRQDQMLLNHDWSLKYRKLVQT